MSKYIVGDRITVKVGDRTFDTIIDNEGVQRFIANGVVRLIVDKMEKDYGWSGEPFNLNTLAQLYYHDKFTQDDYLTFYTMMGYSVCGLAELSFFQDLEIENPVWEKE